MLDARIERPGAARHRALEVGEEGHERQESEVKSTCARMARNAAYLPSSSASFFFCMSSIMRDVLVRDLLHVVERPPLVVFGDLVVLEQLLQPVVGVATHLADGVAAFFGVLVHEPRHFLAALLGQGGNRNAHHLAVGRGIQAEVALLDRAFDRAISDGSNGCATIIVGSGTDSDATWLSGIIVP